MRETERKELRVRERGREREGGEREREGERVCEGGQEWICANEKSTEDGR